MKCSTCSNEVSDDDLFCGHCGNAISMDLKQISTSKLSHKQRKDNSMKKKWGIGVTLMDNPFDDLKYRDNEYEHKRIWAYDYGLKIADQYNPIVTQVLQSYADFLGGEFTIGKSQMLFENFLDKTEPTKDNPIIYQWFCEDKNLQPKVGLTISLLYRRFDKIYSPLPADVHFLYINMRDKNGAYGNHWNIVYFRRNESKNVEVQWGSADKVLENNLTKVIKGLHIARFG